MTPTILTVTMTGSAVNHRRVRAILPHRLSRVALTALISGALLSPLVAEAQTLSCNPAYLIGCVLPGWDDPLSSDCEIWEKGYVIIAPPYPCLPPLRPGYP